ncbi:hypothetical protein ACLOJK_027879 [Asimina triloba]
MDMSYDMVKRCKDAKANISDNNLETLFIVGDEEFLHVKDGELRIASTIAQIEREGGISSRISPLAQVRDAGNLLTRARFTLPDVNVDEYTVQYNSGEYFPSWSPIYLRYMKTTLLALDLIVARRATEYLEMHGRS